jgi:hypothetical protein
MSFHVHYARSGHHPVGPLEICLSSWCMGLRPSPPPEITIGSLRVQTYDEDAQDQLWREDINLVDEQRWQSAIKNARYHQVLRRYHQQFVRNREFQVNDLVLQRVLTQEGANKLSPGWKGPFRVTQVCCPGCVRLATEDGDPLPNPWNIEHLHKFYPQCSDENASSVYVVIVFRSSA